MKKTVNNQAGTVHFELAVTSKITSALCRP
jgi:hypothetical protein